MRNKDLSFGVVVLSIGIIWLLKSLDIITWSISGGFFKLFPLLIIVIGINIIFNNNAIIKIIGWLLFLTSVALYGYFFDSGNKNTDFTFFKEHEVSRSYSVAKPDTTKFGRLNITLGAVKYNIDSTENNLFEVVSKRGNTVSNTVEYLNDKEIAKVNLKNGHDFSVSDGMLKDDVEIDLNDSVSWDMSIDSGAVDGTIDLSDLTVENLNMSVGAGSLNLKLGNRADLLKVNISAGASKMDIDIPEEVGVKARLNGLLKKVDFEDINFEKQDDYYITPGYDRAVKKIDINVEMGVAKIKFNRE